METISSTEGTAPVIAFEHGHRTYLHKGKVHTVTSVGLVTGVGWTFRTSTGIVAAAWQFEAVTADWIVQVPGLPSGFRHVAWEADEGDGFWRFSGSAFTAEVVS